MKRVKTFFGALMLTLAFALTAGKANAQSDNSYEGRARAELHQCIAEAHRNGFQVSSGVFNSCTDGNGQVIVTFVGTRRCAPHEPCPEIASLVGYAIYDCEGNLIEAQCGASPF